MPDNHRAVILNSKSKPVSLSSVPIPTAVPGSVVVRVLSIAILPYLHAVLDGSLPYHLELPLVPGSNCIGRVHTVGPDATILKPGQLVLCDITVTARDDPDSVILLGLHGGGAPRLMEGEWRDGTFAEYAKLPLENVFALDEELVCGRMGYNLEDLASIPGFLVPFGGLSEIDVKAGDTVVVAPSTGKFGGGAVTIALAMGARVVACGRNSSTLAAMKKLFAHTGRLETVTLTGEVAKDTKAIVEASGNRGKGADAYIDFSPAEAAGTTHIEAALGALKVRGRAAFMGGIFGNIEINYSSIMLKTLRIQGRFMYDRAMVVRFIKMIENGNLQLREDDTGVRTVGKFGLEQIEEAVELAKNEPGWGRRVILMP